MVAYVAEAPGYGAIEFEAGTVLTSPTWNRTYYAPPGGYATVSFSCVSTYVRVTGGAPNDWVNIQWCMEIGCDEAQVVDWDRGPVDLLVQLDGEGAFRRDAHGSGSLGGSDTPVAGSYHATSYANIYSPTPGWPPSKTKTDTHPFGVVTQQGGGGGGGS